MKRPAYKQGFTLIELLIVVTIMSVLLGVGSPVLFKSVRAFQFEQNMTTIQGMMNSMRSAALNGRVMPEAANIFTGICSAQTGWDTNYDGICGDITPYAYVFNMEYDAAGALTLRTYADFTNTNIYNQGQDILIDEREIEGDFQVTHAGTRYPLGSGGVPLSTPVNITYSYAFAYPYGELQMWSKTPTSTNEVNLYIDEFTITQPEFNRTLIIRTDRATGIPMEL